MNYKISMKVADILFLPTRQVTIKGQKNGISLRVESIHPRRCAGDVLRVWQAYTKHLCMLFLSYPNFNFCPAYCSRISLSIYSYIYIYIVLCSIFKNLSDQNNLEPTSLLFIALSHRT